MDLELLRTFLEVNRTRHFGHAGTNLHVTQAAVSARIKQLESPLGTPLFVRRYRDLQLTPEGRRLIRHADLQITGWRKARQEVVLGGSAQHISLGGSLRLWDVALQEWLHSLRRQLPDLGLIAESHRPEQLPRRLLDGQLDIVFMLVAGQPGLSVDEAVAQDYLMADWGLTYGLEHRRLFPDAPEPKIRLSQAKMALEHLLAIGGPAYLPVRMVTNHLEDRRLHLVKDAPVIRRHAYAVFPLRSEKIELISEILKLFEYSIDLPRPSH